MVPALQYLANDLAQKDTVDVSLNVEGGTEDLSPAMEVAVYRIVQEALINIRKHAQASHAQVDARFLVDQIVVTVQDDGIGFAVPEDTAELVNMGGLGLMGVEERVQLFGGQMSVESKPGQGTTVRVMLPRNPPPSQFGLYGPETG
jgi:two-component system sensor histidine kinase DegS